MDSRNFPLVDTVLFNLNTFITPKIVKIFYLVGMATITLKFVQAVIIAMSTGFFAGIAGILAATAAAVFSFLILRITAEFIIVFFKNNEALTELSGADDPDQDIFEDVKDSFNALFPHDEDMDLDLGDTPEPAKPARAKPAAARPKPAARSAAKPAAKRTTRAKPATRAKTASRAKPAPKKS